MKTVTLYPQRPVLGTLLCFTALLGLLAVGCSKKASSGTDAAASTTPAPAAPGTPVAGGRPAPSNPNPNAAANAAAFEAARKKAEGK